MGIQYPRTWATLVIRGENLNPTQLTTRLSVNPDFFVEKNLTNLENKPSEPHWQLNSSLPPDASPEEHIYEILKKLAPKRSVFREISKEWEATLYLSVEFADPDSETIRLSPRILLLLGDLGIGLEFVPWLIGT